MRASTLVVAFVCAVLVAMACGGKAPNTHRENKLNDITALWAQIREMRRDAKLPLDPRSEDVMAVYPTSVRDVQRVCPDGHQVPDTCNDICTIADHICDNAEAICDIAAELEDNEWAHGKCASAKASCCEVKQRCCACTDTKATATW